MPKCTFKHRNVFKCIWGKLSDTTVLLVVGTWILAIVAIFTLLDSETALERSQRAWIVPLNETIEDMTVGKPLKIDIEYENSGKEPALHVGEYNEGWMVTDSDMNEALKIVRDKWPSCQKQSISIGANVVYPTSGRSSMFHLVLDKVLADDDIINGKKIFVHYGCFAYETAHSIHHSSFCFFYKSGYTDANKLNGCFTGNYAD